MFRLRNVFGVIVIGAALGSFAVTSQAWAQCSAKELTPAAREVLARVAEGYVLSDLEYYGIREAESVKKASLGPAYAWYRGTWERIRGSSAGNLLANCKLMGYVFPILVEDKVGGCVEANCNGRAGWSSDRDTNRLVIHLLRTFEGISDSSIVRLTIGGSYTFIMFRADAETYITASDERDAKTLSLMRSNDGLYKPKKLSEALPTLESLSSYYLQRQQEREETIKSAPKQRRNGVKYE